MIRLNTLHSREAIDSLTAHNLFTLTKQFFQSSSVLCVPLFVSVILERNVYRAFVRNHLLDVSTSYFL